MLYVDTWINYTESPWLLYLDYVLHSTRTPPGIVPELPDPELESPSPAELGIGLRHPLDVPQRLVPPSHHVLVRIGEIQRVVLLEAEAKLDLCIVVVITRRTCSAAA